MYRMFIAAMFVMTKISNHLNDSQKGTGDFPGGQVVETLPSIAGGAGSIPGQGAKIPRASLPKNQNIKRKQYCNKFNKDFKNGPHQKKSLKKKRTR